jgi:hypothetical protein
MSNGNGVHQPQEDQNPYQLVEEFIQKCDGVDYTDIVMAMLAGAARISILENDSLELFQAQAVVAYERMGKIVREQERKPDSGFPGVIRREC